MGKRRLKLNELIRILGRFGIECDKKRGKGSHILFHRDNLSYPIPGDREVKDCYIRGVRKKFGLQASDGTSDEEFFGK